MPLLKRLQTQADGVRVLIYNGDTDPGISSFKTQVRVSDRFALILRVYRCNFTLACMLLYVRSLLLGKL